MPIGTLGRRRGLRGGLPLRVGGLLTAGREQGRDQRERRQPSRVPHPVRLEGRGLRAVPFAPRARTCLATWARPARGERSSHPAGPGPPQYGIIPSVTDSLAQRRIALTWGTVCL